MDAHSWSHSLSAGCSCGSCCCKSKPLAPDTCTQQNQHTGVANVLLTIASRASDTPLSFQPQRRNKPVISCRAVRGKMHKRNSVSLCAYLYSIELPQQR
jgi:hypothetical protein